MASRRQSSAPSTFKNTSTDAKSSKSVSNGGKANNNAAGKKTVKSSGTIVKSRYLQSAEKTSLSKVIQFVSSLFVFLELFFNKVIHICCMYI
ncbi:hypothetical protein XENORESO_004305 [Xenotaenia resolanae]|uniref:Uncharacterized protein n=1 Tax=Xenotaenia resolanae TaxID=208358 RepID=A0ABV0X5C5_9TELE